MTWTVHFHPGLVADIAGAEEPAPEGVLTLAAALLIGQEGLYDPALARLWLHEFFPQNLALPPAIAFYRVRDAYAPGGDVIVSVEIHAGRTDIVLFAAVRQHGGDLAEFLAQTLTRYQGKVDNPALPLPFLEVAAPMLPAAALDRADALLTRWFRGREIRERYALARKELRKEMAALFNLSEPGIDRMERRFAFVLERLSTHLRAHDAACRLTVVFGDGETLSGAALDEMK